jgi:protein TonB
VDVGQLPELIGPNAFSVTRRKVVTRVKPAYPPEAQRLGLEAYVVLKLTVNPAGDVTKTERINGVVNLRPDEENASARAEFYATNTYAFTIAAESAAREWKFEPANSGMTCFVSFVFRLTPGPDLTQRAPSRPGSPTLSAVPGSSRPGLPVPSGPARLVPRRQTSGPVRVDGQTVKSPMRLVNVNPVYPEEARAARIEGVVILEITIGENGSVTNARVLRSIPMLDQAAIDAVLQWVYEPTLLNGVPIEVAMTVTINFMLR